MKWSKVSQYHMASDRAYVVAKYLVDGQAMYRASLNGRFLGVVQASFDDARRVCESHYQIMGDQPPES